MGIEESVSELPNGAVLLSFNDTTLYITAVARKRYCKAYGIPMFNDVCLNHIKDQLENFKSYEDSERIETVQLVMLKEGRAIRSISINQKISRQYPDIKLTNHNL